VSTPTTVCVNDDLTTGKTSITLRTTNDEETGRLDLTSVSRVFERGCSVSYVVNSLLVKVLLGDDLLNDLLLDLLAKLFR